MWSFIQIDDHNYYLISKYRALGEECSKNYVELYIDAEYSHLQPAVRLLTLSLVKLYNQNYPIIFNTYQCYLKNTITTLENDMKLANELNVYFGCKIVRGAYLQAEKERFKFDMDNFPIHNSYENTNKNYNRYS